MFEKLIELAKEDELIFHKLGLGIGAALGLLIGMIISAKADEYEVEIIEEAPDGETEV